MTLEEMQRIGATCGLTTLGECYINVQRHAISLFSYSQLAEEFDELHTEIKALPEYPDTWEDRMIEPYIIQEAEEQERAFFDSLGDSDDE